MPNTTSNNTDDLTSVVKEAFDLSSASMRTIGGIVRDTALTADTVQQVLESHPDPFVKSQTIAPSGNPVYSINSD